VLARRQHWLGGERVLLLSDETTEVFRRFSCSTEGGVLHGIFLVNRNGEVTWYRISDEALTDLMALQRALR
jgi:hypothetical protein